MFKQRIEEDLKQAVQSLGFPPTDIVCSIPKNPGFGDYSTNVALRLAKHKGLEGKQSAQEIAKKILGHLGNLSYLGKAEVAGGGFINLFLKDEELLSHLSNLSDLGNLRKPSKIFVEYGHTNPLKEVHIGHLRTFILGESLCRILEEVGNQVFRANYQGDIGLHIANATWGIKKLGLPSRDLSLEEKAEFMGKSYAKGNIAYEEDPQAKKEIDAVNISLYQKDKQFSEIYKLAREWSLDYFEPIYALLGVKYDRCFFESEVFERGKEIVLESKIFTKSEGAVIFPGEKYGLHNRVFITSAGNPTYEGKEMGLAELEYKTFEYDKAIHVVAHEQAGYFEVVFKAIGMIFPQLEGKKYHLSYGLVDLKEGKMSSRTGSVITIDDLVKVVSEKVREVMKGSEGEKDPVDPSSIDQEIVKKVAIGAIKFAYLKFSPSPNMVFDLEESVSLDGDSGPYVQYTYARIQSVLKKSLSNLDNLSNLSLERQERALLRQLMYFPEIILEAARSYHPNLIATYLIELSRLFNLFYQECRIIGSEKEDFRLKLSSQVAEVLKKGLYLLGIEAPERM